MQNLKLWFFKTEKILFQTYKKSSSEILDDWFSLIDACKNMFQPDVFVVKEENLISKYSFMRQAKQF